MAAAYAPSLPQPRPAMPMTTSPKGVCAALSTHGGDDPRGHPVASSAAAGDASPPGSRPPRPSAQIHPRRRRHLRPSRGLLCGGGTSPPSRSGPRRHPPRPSARPCPRRRSPLATVPWTCLRRRPHAPRPLRPRPRRYARAPRPRQPTAIPLMRWAPSARPPRRRVFGGGGVPVAAPRWRLRRSP